MKYVKIVYVKQNLSKQTKTQNNNSHNGHVKDYFWLKGLILRISLMYDTWCLESILVNKHWTTKKLLTSNNQKMSVTKLLTVNKQSPIITIKRVCILH